MLFHSAGYPKEVLQLTACYPLLLCFPIQPAQLFFIKPSPCLRCLSNELSKPLPVSLTFHIVRLNHHYFS